MHTKLDMYDYSIQQLTDGTIRVAILLDDPNDAIVQDILSEISQTGTVYVEGFIFEVEKSWIEHQDITSALILESGRINVRGKERYAV